jgi:hypothetical protein
MTSIAVKDQINIIKEAAKQAGESKAKALQFLKDAGIVKQEDSKAVAGKKATGTKK